MKTTWWWKNRGLGAQVSRGGETSFNNLVPESCIQWQREYGSDMIACYSSAFFGINSQYDANAGPGPGIYYYTYPGLATPPPSPNQQIQWQPPIGTQVKYVNNRNGSLGPNVGVPAGQVGWFTCVVSPANPTPVSTPTPTGPGSSASHPKPVYPTGRRA